MWVVGEYDITREREGVMGSYGYGHVVADESYRFMRI
jgi:hypothetical protein